MLVTVWQSIVVAMKEWMVAIIPREALKRKRKFHLEKRKFYLLWLCIYIHSKDWKNTKLLPIKGQWWSVLLISDHS